MTNKTAQRALISWEPVSSRVITARFKTRFRKNTNVIQCYAPSNEANQREKTGFYDLLTPTKSDIC